VIRNARTPEGQELGKQHVRFFEQELSKRPRMLDDRCSTCAFREGTLANGSPQTQMDVVKCYAEGVPFHCHEKGREDILCHGYRLLATKTPGNVTMPWPYSKGTDPMTDNLSQLSDAELSKVFAVEVAGWTPHAVEKKKCHDPEGLSCYWSDVPPFATSANDVLPWLNGYDWTAESHNGAFVKVTVFWPSESTHFIAGTLAHAACAALILAKRAQQP
jgi:hypothetical protein